LAVLNKQLIEDEHHDNPMTIVELEERMRGFLTGPYRAYYCIVDGSVAGYALVKTDVRPIYLRQFFICRDARRKGHGKAFFHALLERLDERIVDIEVLEWNEPAIRFWTSLGFSTRSRSMRYGE